MLAFYLAVAQWLLTLQASCLPHLGREMEVEANRSPPIPVCLLLFKSKVFSKFCLVDFQSFPLVSHGGERRQVTGKDN